MLSPSEHLDPDTAGAVLSADHLQSRLNQRQSSISDEGHNHIGRCRKIKTHGVRLAARASPEITVGVLAVAAAVGLTDDMAIVAGREDLVAVDCGLADADLEGLEGLLSWHGEDTGGQEGKGGDDSVELHDEDCWVGLS